MKHGTACSECDGIGELEFPFIEYHPYGSTVAGEQLYNAEECPECEGRGYFLDDTSCVVCGRPVENGHDLRGWEVHEECMDQPVPRLR